MVTPAGFKKIVAKLVELDASQVQEYKTERDGRIYKVVAVTLYDTNDTVVRVDFTRGEAEARVFTRDRAYHRPAIRGVTELYALSKAIKLAAEIVEHVYGSQSDVPLPSLVVGDK